MKRFTYRYKNIAKAEIASSKKGRDIIRNYRGMAGYVFPSLSLMDDFLEDAVIPEVDYLENDAVYREKPVKAWTFYCDSAPGQTTKNENYSKGNGSQSNPWRNLEYALRQVAAYRNCMASYAKNYDWLCCPEKYYFQIKVKGKINYNIIMYSDDIYIHPPAHFPQIIISPWGDQDVEISSSSIREFTGLVFEHCNFISTVLYHRGFTCVFYDCGFYRALFWFGWGMTELLLIKCNFNNDVDTSDQIFTKDSGITSEQTEMIDCQCQNSWPGYECPVTVYNSEFDIDDWYGVTAANHRPICSKSKIYHSVFNFKDGIYWHRDHIVDARDCIFYNVTLNIDGRTEPDSYDVDATGFSGCHRSVFQNCNVNIIPPDQKCLEYPTGSGKYYGYIDMVGFIGNQDAVYSNCTTTNICQKCADETHECMTPDF